MSNGRHRRASETPSAPKRLISVAAAAIIAGTLLMPVASGADPNRGGPDGAATTKADPPSRVDNIKQVQRRLDALHRQGEIASEAYNTVQVKVQRAGEQLTGLQADLGRQQAKVANLRRQIVASALAEFQSTGGLSASASFFVAKRPSEFIDQLASSAITDHQQADLLAEFSQQANLLTVREQQAEQALASIATDRRQLAEHKAALDDKIAEAKKLLSTLQAKQRAHLRELQRRAEQRAAVDPSRAAVRPGTGGSTQVTGSAPASGRAAIAVQTALAQVGDPYVYGAAGPSSFDCSGLTMYAWAAAGVSLSHASSVQASSGVAVSISALQPGDLVFYYSPVSHVAMYIGNGMVVHAPHPGASVEVVPLTSMPIAWARRVG